MRKRSATPAECKYFDELERHADERAAQIKKKGYLYGGGYEASKGDYEGACLARAEYEAGYFS